MTCVMEHIVTISGTMLAHNAALLTPSNSPSTAPFPSYKHTASVTTFKINTSKSVSKQGTLSLFRINSFQKSRGGVARIFSVSEGLTE